MRSRRALLIMAALRIARTEDDAALPLEIYKCCGPYEMLSGNGSACVNASWPRNHTLRERPQSDHFDLPQVLVQPGDAQWVARWLPPGVPPQRVGEVHVGFLNTFKRKYPQRQMWTVETSAEWDERQVEAAGSAYFSRRVVFIKTEYGSVMGPEPRPFFSSVTLVLGGYRPLGTYCVDAARAPLAPFVLMAQPVCELEVCVRKCCPARQVVQVKDGGGWGCRVDRERAAGWPRRSSFAALLPFQNAAEYLDRLSSCIERQLTDSVTTIALHLSPEDELAAHLLQRRYHNYMWSTWDTCVDFEVLKNGTMRDTIFYCPESRITRGVIWLLRHLCFVSVLLLVVALTSVACNSGMRLKAHGWCLACHTSCLLGFNLGQVSYNMSIGNQVDAFGFVPPHLRNMCRTFAFPMYFLLMAADCWLTALCFNLAWGFRKLQILRPGGGKDWKRFLALSAFAWGLPALMTGLCAYAYERDDTKRRWFSPSLTETRTCFHEVAHELRPHANFVVLASYVAGTALFYYGPVCTLIVANAICVARTLRRVQFLRRGNSVLHREEDNVAPTPRKTGGDDERGGP